MIVQSTLGHIIFATNVTSILEDTSIVNALYMVSGGNSTGESFVAYGAIIVIVSDRWICIRIFYLFIPDYKLKQLLGCLKVKQFQTYKEVQLEIFIWRLYDGC